MSSEFQVTSPEITSSSNNDFIVTIPESQEQVDSAQSKYRSFVKRLSKFWHNDYVRTVVAFLFAIVGLYASTLALSFVHDRVPDRRNYVRLPDIVLDHVKEISWCLDICEYLIYAMNISVLIILFYHKHRMVVMRRLFFIAGMLYLLRALTMTVTVLPISSDTYHCDPQSTETTYAEIFKRSLRIFIGFGLFVNGQQVYCGDYIFSGHTTILILSYLFIKEYSDRSRDWVYWAQWAALFASIAAIFCLVIAHAHYTIDVLFAYLLTTRIFYEYHTMAYNNSLKVAKKPNYFMDVWWFPILVYFEGVEDLPVGEDDCLANVHGAPDWFNDWCCNCDCDADGGSDDKDVAASQDAVDDTKYKVDDDVVDDDNLVND